MKPILYIKGSTTSDVRLNKFIKYFNKINIPVFFIGWKRSKKEDFKEECNHSKYIFKGGGLRNKLLVFYYPMWMLTVFIYFLLKKDLKKYNIISINFDTALPLYLVSKLRKFDFIYEIYDQFAISYKFPIWLKKILFNIDNKIMNKARLIIHVDSNRVKGYENKTIIIENTPEDYYKGENRSYENMKHKFAVVGVLNTKRGLDSILNFAKKNPHIEFIFAGRIIGISTELVNLIFTLKNIQRFDFMPQNELFKLMEDCCGIFSLYNPNIEINLLAASNKVYDAMMLGIPVITNHEVINSKFIKEKEIGLIVNYECDMSWNKLASDDFVNYAIKIGKRGRHYFLNNFIFEDIVKSKLLPYLY